MNNEIILSIMILVSDREETIEKCLGSLVPLMEAVSSELIIVDTAGNEKCLSVVKQYTDKIYPFKWCDDFAAARNTGLRKAVGQWVMFIDDDEWFESTKELEEFFASGLYKQYKTASYFVRNYLNKDGSTWKDSLALRLAKRVKSTTFGGKIHEGLSPLDPPIFHTRDYAHHYGYVFETEEERIEHSWRNIRPLLARIKERPDDYHAASQLIQEYIGTKDYFSAVELCKQLRLKSQGWTKKKLSFTAYAAVRELDIYIRQGRFQDAYKVGSELLQKEENLLFSKGSLTNQMIGICYRLEKYDETVEYIHRFEEIFTRWKSNDGYDKQDLFRIAEGYMLEAELGRFAFMELHIHVMEENWEKAKGIILKIDWDKPEIRMLLDTAEDMVKALAKTEYEADCLAGLKTIMENPRQQEAVRNAIAALEEEEKWNILQYVYQLPLSSEDIGKYHIHYAVYRGLFDQVETVLRKMQEKHYPVLLHDHQYWMDLYEAGINLEPFLTKIRTYERMELISRLLAVMDNEGKDIVYLVLSRGWKKKEFTFLSMTAVWMEEKLLGMEEKLPGMEEKLPGMEEKLPEMEEDDRSDSWSELYKLALHWMSCAASIYKDEVFAKELVHLLPPQYHFAWNILQANVLMEEGKKEYVYKIAEAAKAYPKMKEICKRIMKKAGTEEETRYGTKD